MSPINLEPLHAFLEGRGNLTTRYVNQLVEAGLVVPTDTYQVYRGMSVSKAWLERNAKRKGAGSKHAPHGEVRIRGRYNPKTIATSWATVRRVAAHKAEQLTHYAETPIAVIITAQVSRNQGHLFTVTRKAYQKTAPRHQHEHEVIGLGKIEIQTIGWMSYEK